VQACLQGDEGAWAKLIGRYRNLIYSFPRRYGAGPADAADVFQLVCAELFVALPRLRNHASLRAWIITVAAHQAYHWKRGYVKRVMREGDPPQPETSIVTALPSGDLEMAEREQVMRQAVSQLPQRCRELVQLLFYEDPPVPYHVLAERLGLATGSIGLTRSRCLKKLEQILCDAGMANNQVK
jgi:RNA polymerase sigma factor (sigma-70 family)